MSYLKMPAALLQDRLTLPAGKLNVVLDTDTYNEVDDQFALMYLLKSPERFKMNAVYAAPFFNKRSSGPQDGMEKSYDEILRVLKIMNIDPPEGFVLKGSTHYLGGPDVPCESAAARDLVQRARAAAEPLYVIAIGAITNVASAILMDPGIVEKIVVVWLGGHALYWHDTREFNLAQDIHAARVVFDSSVPLVLIPCMGVTSHLLTTVAELERHLDGKNPIGTYLTSIVREYEGAGNRSAWSKVIWDISAVAFLVNPEWVPTNFVHSPVVTDQATWSVDNRRHMIRCAYWVNRDLIFQDLFMKAGL